MLVKNMATKLVDMRQKTLPQSRAPGCVIGVSDFSRLPKVVKIIFRFVAY